MSEVIPHRLDRLLRPRRVAIVGGRWAEGVAEQCGRLGFTGECWAVHPEREALADIACVASIADLPAVPDVAYIAVNSRDTLTLVRQLAGMGAGGAVCFASGFEASESSNEASSSLPSHAELLAAAGGMPIIGPNCYGFINYLDRVCLWPDQHGGAALERGVAVIAQSSNVAVNISMQRRGVPIAYLLTSGNQISVSLGELGQAMLADARVSAIGLYVEGFGDIRAIEALARTARSCGVPIVALKVGRTPESRAAARSHTRALIGHSEASDAFLDRLGIVRVSTLSVFLETLKLLHVGGVRAGGGLLSMSCSGGEAALVADAADTHGVRLPPLEDTQRQALARVLGPDVALANPLDYHTTIWNRPDDIEAMVSAMLVDEAELAMLVLDMPRADRCDTSAWQLALEAFDRASHGWHGVRLVVSTLAEGLSEAQCLTLLERGIVGLCGVDDALAAIAAASRVSALAEEARQVPVWQPGSGDKVVRLSARAPNGDRAPVPVGRSPSGTVATLQTHRQRARSSIADSTGSRVHELHRPRRSTGGAAANDPETASRMLDESTAKRWLQRFGTVVPRGQRLTFADLRSARRLSQALDRLAPRAPWPVVVKGLGMAHKSESNAVVLNIDTRHELELAIRRIDCAGGCLIEEQILGGVAELLVSVVRDPVHGLLLSVGAGGVLSELLDDLTHALLPVERTEINHMINRLRCAPMLSGYRRQAGVDREILVDAIDSIQQAALQLGERLLELEINPLICLPDACVAVDALVIVDRGDDLGEFQ